MHQTAAKVVGKDTEHEFIPSGLYPKNLAPLMPLMSGDSERCGQFVVGDSLDVRICGRERSGEPHPDPVAQVIYEAMNEVVGMTGVGTRASRDIATKLRQSGLLKDG